MAFPTGGGSRSRPRITLPRHVSGHALVQRPPAPAPVRRAPAPVPLSLAQQANQAVNQQLAPQLAAQDASNARQSTAIQGFAQALLGKLQPLAGQVGADYDRAIQQTGQLSGAAAQFLSNANPSGQVADLLRSAGAPDAQISQVGGQLGQTFGGGAGVLSFLGGAVPGGELAAGKAAMQGQAAQLPGFAALRGQQDLASALAQQGLDRQKLEATRPGLYQSAYNDLAANQLRQQSITASDRRSAASLAERKREFGVSQQGKAADRAQKQKAADFLNWYRSEGVYLSEKRINQKAAQFGVTAAQRQQQIGISQQNANTSSSRAATSAAATQTRLAQSGARLRLAQRHERAYEQRSKRTGKSRLTASQLQSFVGEINDTVTFLRSGVPDTVKASGDTVPGKPALSYADALAYMHEHGYFSTPELAHITTRALKKKYPGAEIKIARGQTLGPGVPTAARPPAAG